MAQPWCTAHVPVLSEDGSNVVVWNVVVSAVAGQHGALELLEREPHKDRPLEVETSEHFKNFLLATCCEKYQALLAPLTAFQSKEWLLRIFKEHIKCGVQPMSLDIVKQTAVSTPKATPKQAFMSPSPLPVISKPHAINPILIPASMHVMMPPPEGYPQRDPSLPPAPPAPLHVEEEEEDENNMSKLRKCHSSPAKLQTQKPQQLVAISKFKANENRRKALLIGINYSGANSLGGAFRDAINLCYLLLTRYDFKPANITLMVDEQVPFDGVRVKKPTHDNIMDAITWLMRDAVAGDSLFFSFSGHGKQVPDLSGDELSGWDQAICTLGDDYIVDDTLHEVLVRRTPKGARLTAIFDACHSGTMLDLPYMYDLSTGIRHDARVPDLHNSSRASITSTEADSDKVGKRQRFRNSLQRMKDRLYKISKKKQTEEQVLVESMTNIINSYASSDTDEEEQIVTQITLASREYQPLPDSKGGEVLMISGCDNKEYANETEMAGERTGLATSSLIAVLEKGKLGDPSKYTYKSLLKEMEELVTAWATDQEPKFSTSHPFNLNSPFIL